MFSWSSTAVKSSPDNDNKMTPSVIVQSQPSLQLAGYASVENSHTNLICNDMMEEIYRAGLQSLGKDVTVIIFTDIEVYGSTN